MMHGYRTKQLTAAMLLACLLVCGVWFMLAGRQTSAEAAPAVSGGIFTVNSSGDGNISNTVLSLHEALLLARGGTGATGLNRGMSLGEWAQVSGSCTFTATVGTVYVSGGCGAGITDTIHFTLAANTVIALTGALPLVNDSAPTTIDGTGVRPIIDATNGGGNGLDIASDNNLIEQLAIENAPSDDFVVNGNSNTLLSVQAWHGGVAGIALAGISNTLNMVRAGITSAFNTVCDGTKANADGIVIIPGSQYDKIEATYAGCNSGYGIDVEDSGTAGFHTLGPANGIGVNANGVPLPNATGIYLSSNSNTIISSTISANQADGIDILRSFNVVMANTVISNAGSGVVLTSLAQDNYVGCSLFCAAVGGNQFSGNSFYGVELSGASVGSNFVEGNLIGVDASGTSAQGNSLAGVLIDGAHDTTVGDAGPGANIISRNHQDGVTLDNGAYHNTIGVNFIGESACPGPCVGSLPNSANGVTVKGGAHDNTIGFAILGNYANHIFYNLGYGVSIAGSNTTTNTVINNSIELNSSGGVDIEGGAHGNNVGGTNTKLNRINDNGSDGILISSGAHDNLINTNNVSANARNGVELTGLGTANNIISDTAVDDNALDGINTRNSAAGNVWSHLQSVAYNAGLPVDLNAPNDNGNIVTPPFPIITSVAQSGGSVVITGTAEAVAAIDGTNKVEVYLVNVNPLGFDGALSYVATAAVDVSGNWTLTLPSSTAGCYIAFQTKGLSGTGQSYSSEFGPNSCRLFLPLIRR